MSPRPRTSPIDGVARGQAARSARSASPTDAALATSPSSSRTSRTASAAAQATGLPPNVEKNVVRAPNRSTISARVMTAAMG